MPPGRKPKKASQSSALEKCIAKLCQELSRNARYGDEINSDVVDLLCEALHSTKARDTITASALGNVLAALENEDGRFCCDLDIKSFCAVLNVVLWAEGCREGERILVILSNELQQKSVSQDVDDPEGSLINIAKAVDVGGLIEYFVDRSMPNGIRRWVGILMIQLLKGPEKVFEQFAHTLEDTRRSIGPMILSEENEIIRLICGRFVRALLNSDILPEELWPVRAKHQDYEDFPTGSQGQSGWKAQFQSWVDGKWPGNESQIPQQMLYFSQSVVTLPPFRLGTLGQNIELVVEDGYILLMMTSEDYLDQILQVPCSSIYQVSCTKNPIVVYNTKVHDVIITIKDDQETFCYLNSRPTTIQRLCLTTDSDINEFLKDLHDHCPQAEFPQEVMRASQTQDEILVQGMGSSPVSECHGKSSEQNGSQHTESDLIPYQDEDFGSQLQIVSQHSRADENGFSEAIDRLDTYQQRTNEKSAADDLTLHGNGDIMNISEPPQLPADQETVPPDEAVEPEVEDTSPTGPELISRQKGESRPGTAQSMSITGEMLTAKADVAADSSAKSDVSALMNNEGDTPMPCTHSSPSQGKQSQPSRTVDRIANKPQRNYLVKPKIPIAASKAKGESHLPAISAKATTVIRDERGSDKVTTSSKTTNIYDFPADEDDQITPKKVSQPTKGKKSKVFRSQQKGKANSKSKGKNGKPCPDPKRTPTEVDQPIVPKRGSQRAAANQAKISMSKIDDDSDEDIEEDLSNIEEIAPTLPNVSRKRKLVEQPVDFDTPALKSITSLEPVLEKAESVFDLQQQDTQDSGLVGNNFPPDDPFQPDDLSIVSPSASRQQQDHSEGKPDGSSRRTAAMNFAIQLDDLLSDDVVGDNKMAHTKIFKKGLFKKGEPPVASPPKLGKLKEGNSAKKSTLIEKEPLEEQSHGSPDDTSHHSGDCDTQGPRSMKDDSFKYEVRQTEEWTAVFAPKRESQENHKVRKIDHVEDRLNTTPVTSGAEKEMDKSVHVTQACPVVEAHSHSSTRFSKGSQQEAVHKSATADTMISNVHRTDPEETAPTSPKPDVMVTEEKKRKVEAEVSLPSKRHRPTPTKSSVDSSISRPAPRQHVKTFPESSAGKNKGLLDDRKIRKPNLIHFGSKGAENQGSSGRSKPVVERDAESHTTPSNMAKGKPKHAARSKRRHVSDEQDEEGLFVSQSPPKKRQSLSPPDLGSPKIASMMTHGESGFMAPAILRSSSQRSRVTGLGSPLAQQDIPSIGQRLKAKQTAPAPAFGQLEPRTLISQQDVPTIAVESPDNDANETPEIFGPRIKVVSIAKARPAAPEASPIRYVAHTKTQDGKYEDISTMQNIQEEKALPDPFIEDIQPKSSGFTKRLRARQAGSRSKADRNLNVPLSDPDKTLVEVQRTTRELSSPGEMTSSSSFRSDDFSSTPTQELSPTHHWALAIRPHYKGYADTVHKIADEMVIRLTNEEDASKLIVKQYSENATNMLDCLASKRNEEILSVRQQIEIKQQALIRMYSEANKIVAQTEEDMKTNSMATFKREWQERQDSILEKLNVGNQK